MTCEREWTNGSLWHRWDPHIHTPVTLKANNFGFDNWELFNQAINSTSHCVEALGITEYGCLTGYKAFRERWLDGEYPRIKFVFPNVEFRMTVITRRERSINIHLLFSPEDEDHIRQIERCLGKLTFHFNGRDYSCAEEQLIDLGRAVDPRQTSDRGALQTGVDQFRLDLDKLRNALNSDVWMRENCLVAVAAAEGDGAAGLQDDGAWATLRTQMEQQSDIIFSSKVGDRKFWLGQKSLKQDEIVEKYGSLKPCMHGSDAHSIDSLFNPDQERYCWIKGNLSWSGFKQTLFEPEERVAIGEHSPTVARGQDVIAKLRVSDANNWLARDVYEFNPGLVAIIGPRGSGKTALADMLAHAAGASDPENRSFLSKAAEHIQEETACINWGDGSVGDSTLLGEQLDCFSEERVRYLSQQFVDRLCSEAGLAKELVAEIENVVFSALSEPERLGCESFSELRKRKLRDVHAQRNHQNSRVSSCTTEYDEAQKLIDQSEETNKKIATLKQQIQGREAALRKIIPKTKSKEVAQLTRVQNSISTLESKLTVINRKLADLSSLKGELIRIADKQEELRIQLSQKYRVLELKPDVWKSICPEPDDVSAILADTKASLEKQVTKIMGNETNDKLPPDKDYPTWTKAQLRIEESRLQQIIGGLENDQKRYESIQASIRSLQGDLKKLENKKSRIDKAMQDRESARQRRRIAYATVFQTYKDEEKVLQELYEPLSKHIDTMHSTVAKLQFTIVRKVDEAVWLSKGETLLDSRFEEHSRVREQIEKTVREVLLPAWISGDGNSVGQAIDTFIQEHAKAIYRLKRKTVPISDLASWVFSTDHITLEYGLEYDQTSVEVLSPGMRGIVLLLLYLAIDRWDSRPLIVDQPEENLDPKSVYEELVKYFRIARRRRQVILVTHNANLVVNADADQVIIADSVREQPGRLPRIIHISGALEDDDIRSEVCSILEGGMRAFRERELRYQRVALTNKKI